VSSLFQAELFSGQLCLETPNHPAGSLQSTRPALLATNAVQGVQSCILISTILERQRARLADWHCQMGSRTLALSIAAWISLTCYIPVHNNKSGVFSKILDFSLNFFFGFKV
jgi:hypothetical protein